MKEVYVCSVVCFKQRISRKTEEDGFMGLGVRIPQGAGMSLSCECCVRRGRGLCDGPIPRPEESLPSVSLNVIRCNNNPQRVQGVGRRGQRNKEIRTTVLLSLITGTRQCKPVVFAVTFALFYKLVAVHSGFD